MVEQGGRDNAEHSTTGQRRAGNDGSKARRQGTLREGVTTQHAHKGWLH